MENDKSSFEFVFIPSEILMEIDLLKMSNFSFHLSSHSAEEINTSLMLVGDSFGDTDIADKNYYEWQYLRNPIGNGTVLIAYQDGQPAGQFACIPCLYRYETKEMVIPLTLNLCVLPKFRGKGLMPQLITMMHEHLRKGNKFSIGVPNQSSIGGHLKNGYVPLKVPILVKPVRLSHYFRDGLLRSSLAPMDSVWRKKSLDSRVRVNGGLSESEIIEFERHHSSGKVLIQARTFSYLSWRYWQNPRRQYTTISYRNEDGILQGYAIVRTAQINGKEMGIIADLLVLSIEAGKKLISSVLAFFWKKEVAFTICSTFGGNLEFECLRDAGFFILPTRFRPHPLALCIRFFQVESPLRDEIRNPKAWFFMLGDNDAL